MDVDVFFVVDNTKDWPPEMPGAEVVAARDYLTNPRYGSGAKGRVFNLCGSYTYQSFGYYVSLLAAARGHKPLPSVTAIQEMKSLTILRFVSEELDELIQESLTRARTDRFTLSIYFGRNVAKHYDRLCAVLFQQFQAPLLRARFVKNNQKWILQSIKPIPTSEIPDDHWSYVIDFSQEYFAKRPQPVRKKVQGRYDLGILYNPEESTKPSNEKAIKKFIKAAESMGFDVELISKEDYGRIAEFDALFIRETTNVHHHTYRFAQRAEAEGVVVLDDQESILKCSNKVYLAELLERYHIDKPKTVIVDKYTRDRIGRELDLPCVLKQPDSSFSQGVHKAATHEELEAALDDLLDKSDLIIAQEFLPTEYDWRVGILDRQPLFVCKYHMAPNDWKIQHTDETGETDYGKVETMAWEDAPKKVVKTALAAANLIGDGLYGVDLKQVGNRICVIEVNDNPNIDCGFEDEVLKDKLYHKVMEVFLHRVEKRKERKSPSRSKEHDDKDKDERDDDSAT